MVFPYDKKGALWYAKCVQYGDNMTCWENAPRNRSQATHILPRSHCLTWGKIKNKKKKNLAELQNAASRHISDIDMTHHNHVSALNWPKAKVGRIIAFCIFAPLPNV